MPTLAQKADYWEKELLDLSRRNRMLHFRETKRSSLVIETPDFFEMYRQIVTEERCLTFRHPIGRDVDPRAYYLLRLMMQAQAPVDVFTGDIRTNQRMDDQMITLRSLKNKAQLAFDEQGTNLLYLAFGFIHWFDGDRKTGPMNSPFLLVPVSFTGTEGNIFKLKLYEDDITINPTLAYALEQKRHFVFPAFDSEKESFPDYIDRLIPLLDRAGMRFERKCCLGILSFLKINMYLDLTKNRKLVEENTVLAQIYTSQSSAQQHSFDHDAQPYEHSRQVLSADSSQLDAIALSRQGKSFVLQGPPGTGKSQTIANIIAQALADGKKVLFVSEKMAALQVVYRRLEEVGLGDFCLPLHDYKADKKQILQQIEKPLNLKRRRANPDAATKLAQFETLKNRLNLYPQQMHRVQSAYRMSLYDAMSRLEDFKDVPDGKASVKAPHTLDRLTLLRRQESLARFGHTVEAMTVSPQENPWHGYQADAHLPEERQKAKGLIESYLQAVNSALLLTAQAREEFGLSVQPVPAQLQHAASLLSALLRLPALPEMWFGPDAQALKSEAETEKQKQAAYRASKESVEAFFIKLPPMDTASQWCAEFTRLQSALDAFGVSMDELKASREKFRRAGQQLDSFIAAWERDVSVFWCADRPIGAVQGLYELLSRIPGLSVFTPAWIQPEARVNAAAAFRESYRHHQNIHRLSAVLEELGYVSGSADALEAEYAEWKKAFFPALPDLLAPVLECSWQKEPQALFISMPALSAAAWVGQMDDLLNVIEPARGFRLDQTDESKEICAKAAAQLAALESAVEPFITLLNDFSYGQCICFLEKLESIGEYLPLPFAWTKQSGREDARQKLTQFMAIWDDIKRQRDLILNNYTPTVFNLPVEEMLGRFETEYTTFFGRLKPQRKRDLQQIGQCSKPLPSQIDDIEACRVLRALKQLKQTELTYRDYWKQNGCLLAAGVVDPPENWSAIKEKFEAFGRFCEREENAYIESFAPEMLDAVPAALTAAKEMSVSVLSGILRLWLGDATDLSLSQVRQRMDTQARALSGITDLFQRLSMYLKPDAAQGDVFSAMKDFALKQERAAEQTVSALRELDEEKRLYDELKVQRIMWLEPFWREDNPLWDELRNTFDLLSQDSLQEALDQIALLMPNVTSVELAELYENLKGHAPGPLLQLIRSAGGKIDPAASAAKQAEALRSGLNLIDRALHFLEPAASYAPERALPTGIAGHMRRLAELHTLIREQDQRQDRCMMRFGDTYTGWSTDWDRILQDLERWHITLSQFPEIKKQPGAYRAILCAEERGVYELWADKATRTANAWLDAWNAIEAAFEKGTFSALTREERMERLSRAADHMEYLEQWQRYTMDRRRIGADGLEQAVKAFEDNHVPPRMYSRAYEKAFLLAWINKALGDAEELTRFDVSEKEADIDAYRQLSRIYLDINRERLKEELIGRVPEQESGGEMKILKRELSKKSRIMPLRKLFREIPYLLMRLKPCLMMSPLSVSYFLDAEQYKFDMVIFDEASQIFPQDAIGAILRGKQAIIAGDTRQMPPTDFFFTDSEEDEEEDGDETGAPLGDSILEEADYSLPTLRLLWHYRSRDEQLIAFSNRHFYGDKLYTFPNNSRQQQDTGVEYIYVPDGIYAKRHNDREAAVCLQLIREHYQKHPDRSLGVVAFNEAQQSAIENLVWKAREENSYFASLMDKNQVEPFFVKNLENVQGDERDTIIFSVCFGHAPDGKFRYNFGPLGKAGGERRLNVAVTRAKCNVKLVGSIHAEDIDLNRAKSEGARMLRFYIDYASHPNSAGSTAQTAPDAFADAVARYLEESGYQIKRNVGRSAYTVDIAVYSGADLSEFTAAVQCDGENYALARTACDREDIRRSMLERLNWRIVNCWCADWFSHPEEARGRLTDQLRRRASRSAYRAPQPAASSQPDGTREQAPKPDETARRPAERSLPEYRTASEVRFLTTDYPAAYTEYMKHILHCIRVEQPICPELLYRRMAPLWSRQMVTSYVREKVDECLRQMTGAVKLTDGWYVLSNYAGAQARTAGDREIDQISLEELEAVLAFVIKPAFGMERQEVISVTARLMGYQRTGPRIIARLGEALERLHARKKISIVYDKVQWKEEDA